MPTPHGSRGGMAFSADELRVLRRALSAALQSSTTTPTPDDVREYLRLVEDVDEAAREAGRLRTFLLAELARYRAALPGSAAGYLERLTGALDTGYVPVPDDLAALRMLRTHPSSAAETHRRYGVLRRCEHLAELDVRARLAARIPAPAAPPVTARPGRTRLRALPGGRTAADDPAERGGGREPKPAPRPDPRTPPADPGSPEHDEPKRKVPTPAEIFPPRRRTPPRPPEQLATG
ncbi:hypothetical protein [Streptomyces sp. NPDC088733]|uniref:hypothetical protein n=1 Tax=Streptomyces sp. NPDC088733 TaxID=3365880 RepID=UPI0038061716